MISRGFCLSDSMKIAFFISLLLLCAPIFAVADVGQASFHNIAIASSLLGAKNACNAPLHLPSSDDIFFVADVRIVSLIPQVGNATSDLSNASVLWSWSADFPQEARFSIREEERCPAGEIRYSAPSNPSLSGAISYLYGNSTETLLLSSASANPIPLNLSAGKLIDADFLQPFANLPLTLHAALSVAYSFSKSSYSYQCVSKDGYVGCGCEGTFYRGIRTFQRNFSDARNFSVEVGPNSLLWLNPPLSSRLSGNETGKIALFARRLPANISLVFRGKEIAAAQPYSFSTRTGGCGEKIVGRTFSPQQASLQGVFMNTSAPIFPSQLVDKNASYFPFYLEFPWHADAGKANFTIAYEDAFSIQQEFSREFFVREPTQFSSTLGASSTGEAMEKTAAGGEAEIEKSATGSNGAMEKRKASDDATAAAYPARAQPGAFPDFSLVAAAFAFPLAIGAAAVARRLEWL